MRRPQGRAVYAPFSNLWINMVWKKEKIQKSGKISESRKFGKGP